MDKGTIKIVRLQEVDSIAPLAEIARSEGFRFLDRLIREWHSCEIRFDSANEVLLGAFVDSELVGTAGITNQELTLGRIRRVYVHPDYRRSRIASQLMNHLIEGAVGHFSSLVLRTDNPDAERFYEQLGFLREAAGSLDRATHRLTLEAIST